MMIARQDLNRWRAFCARLATALCSLEAALEANEAARAREIAAAALGATLRLGMNLELAGADPPGLNPGLRAVRPETPCAAERWYALMLRDAWDAARALDAARRGQGGCDAPDQEGENARLLRLLLKEVEADLYACPVE
jgi:hypothetical protein